MVNILKFLERDDKKNLQKVIAKEVEKNMDVHPLVKPILDEIEDNNKAINILRNASKNY